MILETLEVSRSNKKLLLFAQRGSEMCCPVLPRTVRAPREIEITRHLSGCPSSADFGSILVPRVEDCSGSAILNLKVGRSLGNKSHR